MSQIAEELAAERIIPHVLENAAAINVGVGLLQFLGVAIGKRFTSSFRMEASQRESTMASCVSTE